MHRSCTFRINQKSWINLPQDPKRRPQVPKSSIRGSQRFHQELTNKEALRQNDPRAGTRAQVGQEVYVEVIFDFEF